MKFFIFLTIFVSFIDNSKAQEIAILDQGLNTNIDNRGIFYNPLCIIERDNFRSADDVLPLVDVPGEDFVQGELNLNGAHVSIFRIGLCSNGFLSLPSEAGANVPRFRSLNDLTPSNIPYEEVALVSGQNSFSLLSAPYKDKAFGSSLRHGSDVANAAYDFDRDVKRKMVQIYHIESRIRTTSSTGACLADSIVEFTTNTGVIGGTDKVLEALDKIANNPDGVDAINFSIVFRMPCNLRSLGNLIPDACRNDVGEDLIQDLKDIGIPVIASLDNVDIGESEQTWPACIDNVIQAGADNGNRQLANGGIGIGDNISNQDDYIFYADNENQFGRAGNSMAAPKVAAAYALLAEAVPNSTVDQRTEALIGASSKDIEYDGYIGSVILRKDIDDAIELLEKLVVGNVSEISFNDSNQYGSTYGDTSSDYTFSLNFDELVGVTANSSTNLSASNLLSARSANTDGRRDVVISFNSLMSSHTSNGLYLYINNIRRENIGRFEGARNFEFLFNRNIFNSGTNTIRIEPSKSTLPWGLSNIKADFHPAVSLTFGQIDTSEYGYSYTPKRYTGLRATFIIDNIDTNYRLSVDGWDIDSVDENEIFINGLSLGHLSVSNSSAYNGGDKFLLRKEDLVLGNNVIEFVQRYPDNNWTGFEDEKWAVKNILVGLVPKLDYFPSIYLYLLDED